MSEKITLQCYDLSLKTHLLGLLHRDSLLLLGLLVLRLLTQDTATPSSADCNVVDVLSLEGLGEGVQVSLILLSNRGQADNSSVLLVNEGTKSSLALQDAERYILLSAERGQPANELDGVNIVGYDDELSLLVLNQGCDLMDTILEGQGLMLLGFLTGGLGPGNLLHAHLLLLRSLGRVLLHQLKQLSSLILVKSIGELIHHRGDLIRERYRQEGIIVPLV
jgi:hypothetical protein